MSFDLSLFCVIAQDPDNFPWPKANASTVAPGQVGAYENLSSALDGRRSNVLNADDGADLAALLSEKGGTLSSESDEQLIINLHFVSPVKLHSFCLVGKVENLAPKSVKLFVNRSLGFEDTDLPPTQTFVLDKKNAQPVLVNFVQYQVPFLLLSVCLVLSLLEMA